MIFFSVLVNVCMIFPGFWLQDPGGQNETDPNGSATLGETDLKGDEKKQTVKMEEEH